jgi:hypothetical protein
MFEGDLLYRSREEQALKQETGCKQTAEKSYPSGPEAVDPVNLILPSQLFPDTGEDRIELVFLDFKPLLPGHCLKLHIPGLSDKFPLAPSPCTGTVGHEKSEKTSDEQAFYDIPSGNTFHKPSFGEVEEEKTQDGTNEDGRYGGFEPRGLFDTGEPVPLRFDVQLFELHICIYVDNRMCKNKYFLVTLH